MKIKQSETVEIMRSQIKFADYNPRIDDPNIVESIKKNFKNVGFFGGIVWNETTGNLISGHKRVMTLDEINHYPEKDYKIKVEKVALDLKTEMEQNIYMNNESVQGRFDYKKLSVMLKDIDFDKTGLTQVHLDKIRVFNPTLKGFEPEPEPEKKEATPEQIEKLKEIKKEIKSDVQDKHEDTENSYLTIIFENWDEKTSFCENFGIDIDSKFINSEELIEKLNN